MKFSSARTASRSVFRFGLAVFLLLGSLAPLVYPTLVHAAPTGYLRLDRMATTTGTSGTVCMTVDNGATVGQVVVTFPGNGTQGAASFGVNGTFGNWTVTTTNLPTGASAWPGINTATAVSGASVTFPASSMTNSTLYCFNFSGTTTLTNPTNAGTNLSGTIQTQTAGAAALETINFATSIIANDQVLVTATVPPTFSMSLSGNAASLGTLPTSGAPASANVTMTVSTNATNGWLAWVKNANANSTLTSATTGDTTISSGAYTTGVGNIHDLTDAAGYGLRAVTGTGTPTIATEYAAGASSVGSLDSTQFRQFASNSTVAAGNTVTLSFMAEALATTKAATDYTDTVTVTAAGQF